MSVGGNAEEMLRKWFPSLLGRRGRRGEARLPQPSPSALPSSPRPWPTPPVSVDMKPNNEDHKTHGFQNLSVMKGNVSGKVWKGKGRRNIELRVFQRLSFMCPNNSVFLNSRTFILFLLLRRQVGRIHDWVCHRFMFSLLYITAPPTGQSPCPPRHIPGGPPSALASPRVPGLWDPCW